MAGKPRKTVTAEERKRMTTPYKQDCLSFFRLSLKKMNQQHFLVISAHVDAHNYLRSESLYKAMPKQRQLTVDESTDFLSRVINIVPNIQLLQKEVASSSAMHGVVNRAKNAIHLNSN